MVKKIVVLLIRVPPLLQHCQLATSLHKLKKKCKPIFFVPFLWNLICYGIIGITCGWSYRVLIDYCFFFFIPFVYFSELWSDRPRLSLVVQYISR